MGEYIGPLVDAPVAKPKVQINPALVNAITPSAAPPVQSAQPVVGMSPKDQAAFNLSQKNRMAAEAIEIEKEKRKKEDPLASMTESERTAGFLLQRLDFAEKQLKDTLQKNPDATKPEYLPTFVENFSDTGANLIRSTPRQQIETAQYEILDTALTLGTGASYTPAQIKNYAKSYFAQIGDSPTVIKDKEDRLANVVSAAKIKAGRAAQLMPEAKVGNKPPTGAPPDAKQAPDGKWYSPDPARPGKYIQY
tara:strand:+ start:310 stop:1059 length:750 start_codon:yes stop_codon:yes gene_type:complete